MEQKFLKRKPRKIAPGRAVSMRPPQEKVVLVGTYKGKQLERWTGYYNYPLSEDEFLAAELQEYEDFALALRCVVKCWKSL